MRHSRHVGKDAILALSLVATGTRGFPLHREVLYSYVHSLTIIIESIMARSCGRSPARHKNVQLSDAAAYRRCGTQHGRLSDVREKSRP
ncbi:hypothetical protein IG631_24242 [Alternaria alternata]|nr:hypothetical protein IG631_24242 [Alternaria alternata]